MESKKAQKLISKILADLDHAGIILNTLVEDLKELRTYAKKEQNPLATKVLRLAYEYIEDNETFDIAIPDDEPLFEDGDAVSADADDEVDAKESISYLISLFKDLENKNNVSDLKHYRDILWGELY